MQREECAARAVEHCLHGVAGCLDDAGNVVLTINVAAEAGLSGAVAAAIVEAAQHGFQVGQICGEIALGDFVAMTRRGTCAPAVRLII